MQKWDYKIETDILNYNIFGFDDVLHRIQLLRIMNRHEFLELISVWEKLDQERMDIVHTCSRRVNTLQDKLRKLHILYTHARYDREYRVWNRKQKDALKQGIRSLKSQKKTELMAWKQHYRQDLRSTFLEILWQSDEFPRDVIDWGFDQKNYLHFWYMV